MSHSAQRPPIALTTITLSILLLAIAATPTLEARPQLGMNLAGPADWNTELPFVEVFRMSRPWTSQREGESWGRGPKLELDEYGWVKRLEKDCWAESPLCTISDGHYPAGRYTILYEGKGKIEVWNAGDVASAQPGLIIFNATPERGGFHLRLLETDPKDYIRNIRVIMPGFVDTYKDNPWHPAFLNRWKGVACLRFMDFMHTNGSKIAFWSQRPSLDDATFSRKGIALELLIDLANRLDADPWFCIPHLADDHYVRNFAEMVKQNLDANLKIYVEYSNETWNGMFPQSKYAGEQGQRLGFAEKPWEAGWRYTAYRSVQIFKICEQVFEGKDRLVRILPSQAANPYVSERIVEFQDAYKNADALAIAPYISFNIRPGGKPAAEDVAQWTVEQVLDHIENKALPESIKWIQGNKEIADKYNLKLMTYEGGQHMVGVAGGENNEKLTALLQKANAHQRIAKIYQKHYQAWEQNGGDLFCYFSSVSKWSKWGSWGLLQYYDDNLEESPKYKATMTWARSLGQQVNTSAKTPAKEKQTKTGAIRTFHIGNSLTDTVNDWLEPLAKSAGQNLDFHRFTIPGAPTDWLWNHPGSGFGDSDYKKAFTELAPLDHIFTQPFAGHDRSIENEADYSGRFFEACRGHSPDVQPWLYIQWPGPEFEDRWAQAAGAAANLNLTPATTWQQGVANHAAYTEAVKKRIDDALEGKDVLIVPGGLALAALKTEIDAGRVPGMTNLFKETFADGIHMTAKGRYLISLVHYVCIYKQDPTAKVSTLESGLTEPQAAIFQRIAFETVRAYKYSGYK